MGHPEIEAVCQAAARDGVAHGVVAAVGRAGGVDRLWSWGQAAVVPAARPMSTAMRFDIASLTKVVATAAACGLCIDRGWLDPTAPAGEVLPGLGERPGQRPRLCDLAMHIAGYDNRKFNAPGAGLLWDAVLTTPPTWAPGEHYEYSCRNFLLLGLAVEAVTGVGLGPFCAAHLFGPLGMANTAFGPLVDDLDRVVPSEQPPGVISDGQARAAGRPVGNAGLFSAAADLACFCRMMLQGGQWGGQRILGDRAIEWLTRPHTPAGLPRRSFGWDLRAVEECPHRPRRLSSSAFGHGGWTGQSLWVDPERDRFVVVLTNRTHAPGNPANYDTSQRFRGQLGDLLLASVG
ncbi:MAG: beta-lactamase family protein [Lentisphaerae bacterium]|nr:beta-lactamase family protein [Lentisphaerota bacterium]